jgi:transglutaminase-like putative cysteine protease
MPYSQSYNHSYQNNPKQCRSLYLAGNNQQIITKKLVIARILAKAGARTTTIRRLAIEITAPYKNDVQKLEAVHKWIRDNIAFIQDTAGAETFQTPVKTLDLKGGDCDDLAILARAILASIGFICRWGLVYHGASARHIFVWVYYPARRAMFRVAFDVTMPELNDVRLSGG